MAICLPAWFWLHDHAEYRSNTVGRKAIYYLHCFILLLGTFLTVGGTYGTVQQVVDEYANGSIGELTAFSTLFNWMLIGLKVPFSVAQIIPDQPE
jgi:hypothetical protein